MKTLSAEAIRSALGSLPRWRKSGSKIQRVLEFADFVAAMKFVNSVARAAEKANHHPDIDIRWNRVVLSLTTHDAGGLTRNDFEMAGECDRLADRQLKSKK